MILCISHSNDYYTIDIVIKRLEELGEKVYRLNSDEFSNNVSISCKNIGKKTAIEIIDGEYRFTTDEIKAVWYRKLWELKIPKDLDKSYYSIFYQEYGTLHKLFFDALKDKFWINPMDIDHSIGGNKFKQLQLAQESGLVIPESIFTNNSKQVEVFFNEVCEGKMITKLHGSLSRSMKRDGAFFPTTLVSKEHLEALKEGLEFCPMIFQRNIEKMYELRVVYVNGVFFVGKINATQSESGNIDWRAAKEKNIGWGLYTLPEKVCNAITLMMNKMGLYFGAIDIIRQTDGEYVFLEVNPQGEWGMLQRDLGYPIGETIAEQIIETIRR